MNTYHTAIPLEIFLGHRKRVRHPSIRPHITGRPLPIDVVDPISFQQSMHHAKQALGAARHVWWVGDHKMASGLDAFGTKHHQQVISGRWPAGLLTNFHKVSQSPRWEKPPQFPDLVVVLSVARQPIAVRETKAMGITTIGVVDSNANPNLVDHPIYANDDHRGAMGWLVEQLM